MLYKETIAVCSQIHTKHKNTAMWAERRIVVFKLAFHKVNLRLEKVRKGTWCRVQYGLLFREDAQTQRASHSWQNNSTFSFPVTIKAPRLIEAYKCDCPLISLLLFCGKGAIPTEKVKVKIISFKAWTSSEISRSLRPPDFKTIGTWGSKFIKPIHRPPLPPR